MESLRKSVYQGENSEISLSEKLAHKENPQEKLLNRILLEELLAHLDKRERQLICMRYFRDMTQMEEWRQNWGFPRCRSPDWKSGS